MPHLINAITLLLIVFSTDSYGIEVEGIKIENIGGESLLAAPEGAHDPAGTLVFSNRAQTEVLKIRVKKNLDNKTANSILNQKIIQLSSLYKPAAVPYAGAITSSIDCSKKYNLTQTPADNKEAIIARFKLEANEQLVYGVCEEKKLEYKSEYVLNFCKNNKNFYEIRYFNNKKNKKQINLTVDCI